MKRKLLLIFFAVCLLSKLQAQEVEPNNTPATANTLLQNGSQSGAINPGGDIDWYKLTTKGDGQINLNLTSLGGNYIMATLYDNDGVTQLNQNNTNGNITISTDGLAAGTYYVEIQAYYNGQTGSYTLADTLIAPIYSNDPEPNNSFSQATILPLNGSVQGHVDYYYNGQRDSSDWYKLTTNGDGAIQLSLTSGNGNYVRCILYDGDGVTPLQDFDANQGVNTVTTDGLAAGTYYLQVFSYYNNQFEPYLLQNSLIVPTIKNDQEPNNNINQALTMPLNGTVQGHVGYYYNNTRDTSDWYRLTTNADGQIQLTITSGNGNYVRCLLYDGDGKNILLDFNAIQGSNTASYDGLAVGTYYVQVLSYYNSQFEPYILSNTLNLPLIPADHEPNNTPAQALTLLVDSSARGHVGYYYDNYRDTADWYKLQTKQDGALQLGITSGNGNYVYCELYDSDATTLLTNFNALQNTAISTVDGLAAGTYYIRVSSYYNSQFEPYILQDTLITPPFADDKEPNNTPAQADVMPLNGTVTGHVGYYNDNTRDTADWYKVTTNADGELRLTLQSGNGNYVACVLYDSNATTQLNSFNVLQTAGSLYTDGLAAGTYYVRITSYYNSQFEPYQLSDSLFTYNPNDPEPNKRPYQATLIPANATATGHVGFYYNGARDSTDWWKINYNDSSGNLKFNFSLLPNLVGGTPYTWFQLYSDTTASPIYNNNFNSDSSSISLTGLKAGTYYIDVFPYNNSQFVAYSITPTFKPSYYTAGIKLLKAVQSDSCSANTISYTLSGNTSQYTPYTVILFRNGVSYDSIKTPADTAAFTYLPDGKYYAAVHAFDAPANTYASSDTTTFTAPKTAVIPKDVPYITNIGRTLYSTAHAARETYQWYDNNVLIAAASDSSYIAYDSGHYTARFANACGVGNPSDTIYFPTVYKTQTINFPAPANANYSGNLYIVLHATATSGLPVTYKVVSGPAVIGTDTVYVTGVGSITVEADQAGNNTYAPAPAIQQTFSVAQASQTITFPSPGNTKYGDTAFALHASANSGLPISYSVVSGPANISNDSFVTVTGAGSIVLQASQSGNNNFSAANNIQVTICAGIKSAGPISGDSIVCPSTFKYSVPQITGATYVWGLTGGGTLSAVGDTASVVWKTQGKYVLYVQAYSACDAARSDSSKLIINQAGVQQPVAVTSMLPANGSANQQLPLTLSWIPGAQTSTYDLYVWNKDSAKPAVPLAAGLSAVNFTLPQLGLPYHKTYDWSITSRNACAYTAGPIQTFALIPLPDLAITDLQSPTSGFSGQPVTIKWTVTNHGPGSTTTNQSWTDAVFLSLDTTADFTIPPNTNPPAWNALQFPVKPLLIGAVPNVSALDSGQSYSNSISFTLPSNYNWPVYAYVITNYSPGINAPLEVTKVNDTAFNRTPINVQLSPTPDLRVDSVVAPASVFSGSAINVTYKVKNYGTTTPYGTYWYDAVYISQQPFFDATTATLLSAPKFNGTYYFNPPPAQFPGPSQLQGDSAYYRSQSVIIPNFIQGTFFIYVFTDAGNNVYEGTLENNNIGSTKIQVYLTPTPALNVTGITLPSASASTTQPIGINWNIANNGYYDNLQMNQGHYLDTIQFCNVCYIPYCNPPPPPPPNCNTCGVYVCPAPEPGYRVRDSLSWGTSHWQDYIYLSSDSTGLNKNASYLGSFLHGAKDPIQDYDDATSIPLIPGTNIEFGSGIPAGANPRNYDVNTSNVIRPAGAYPGNYTFSLPDNLAQGNYYIYVWANADSEVYEYPSLKSVKRSSAIAVYRPDLTVTSVTIPQTATAGQSLTLNYTVENIGKGNVYNHIRHDAIYISTSNVFDANAQLVTLESFVENVLVDVPVQHSVPIGVPQMLSGNFYVYVFTNEDSLFKETTMSNNINGTTGNANTVKISQPVVPNISANSISIPDSVYSILGFPVKYTVTNTGPGSTSGLWIDSIYISCSSVFNAATAIGVAARPHNDTVATNGSYTDSFTLVLPYTFNLSSCFGEGNAKAYFFVKSNANGSLYQGTFTGGTPGTGAVIVINPLVDQTVTGISAPDTATVGRSYPAVWSVENIGFNPGSQYYSSWVDALYFSPDSVFNANAVTAGYSSQNTPLNTGQSYTGSYNFTTPNIPGGDYYVFVYTNSSNSIPAEHNLANNISLLRNSFGLPQTVQVTVPPLPDLTDTILYANTPVATGQPISVKFSVANKGIGVTYPSTWSDDVWLSGDYIPGNAGDIYLGSINHSGVLQPGQSYTDSFSVTVPMSVPPGNYVLIVRTNATNNVIESNSANNLAFTYVDVFNPAPSDLTVINVTHSDTAILGDTSNIGWTISNIGANNAVGYETDGIYFSKSSVFDSTAVLMGTQQNVLNLIPLAAEPFKTPVYVKNITEGQYYVMVKTDLLDNITETNKDNNTGVSAKPVYVKVKQLQLGVITHDSTIGNNTLYYKVVIPASLNGATILVTLKSNDSLSENNQMYTGLGYIPSAAQFDYEFGSPNSGNQQILMPSVNDSVYYIAVQCVSPTAPNQHVTLEAVNLPFSILNVNSNQGGNTGNVTVLLTGSLFADTMKATLYSETGKNTITASAVYYVNSTMAYATFNLLNQPLGVYDVVLTKTNGDNATLANSFTVEAANNGGLITGSGVNTGQTGSGGTPGCDPGATSGLNSQLQTQLVIPAKVFAGWVFTIQINYTNPTNVDIPVQTRILYSLDGLPVSLTQSGLATATSSLYIQFGEQNGPPNIIRAGSSGTITVYCQVPASYPGHKLAHFDLK